MAEGVLALLIRKSKENIRQKSNKRKNYTVPKLIIQTVRIFCNAPKIKAGNLFAWLIGFTEFGEIPRRRLLAMVHADWSDQIESVSLNDIDLFILCYSQRDVILYKGWSDL